MHINLCDHEWGSRLIVAMIEWYICRTVLPSCMYISIIITAQQSDAYSQVNQQMRTDTVTFHKWHIQLNVHATVKSIYSENCGKLYSDHHSDYNSSQFSLPGSDVHYLFFTVHACTCALTYVIVYFHLYSIMHYYICSSNKHAQSQVRMKFIVLLLLLLGKPVMEWVTAGCERPIPENCIDNPRIRLSKNCCSYKLQLCDNNQCIPSDIDDAKKWLKCRDGKKKTP